MQAREWEAAPGTLSERLRSDNRRIEDAVAEVGRCLHEGRLTAARDALCGCIAAWERQVRLEEEVLYPLFELRLGTSGDGTAAMRDEHKEIRRAFASLDDLLALGRDSTSRKALEALLAVLESHQSREDRVVYPTLDAMLTDGERGRLLARIQALSAEPAADGSRRP